jgi:hypothetical protein
MRWLAKRYLMANPQLMAGVHPPAGNDAKNT